MSRESFCHEWITEVTHQAMATEFAILLPRRWANRVEAAVAALEQLDALESQMTIYRGGGEVDRLNHMAADQPVTVSQELFELLQQAQLWSERTEGAFDITAGPFVEVWGFTRRSGRKPTAAEIKAAAESVGYQHLLLAANVCQVKFSRPKMSINLGAIGKGAALDRIANQLRTEGIRDFLIHGGQSSLIAAGNQQEGVDTGWSVGIAHPTKPARRIGGIWVKDQALATSGSGKQFFHHRGRRYGHVIDPRTGYPSGDWLSLTVLMPKATDADACATGLFVLGESAIQSMAGEAWFPSFVAVKQAERQDQVSWESSGEIHWVESETNSSAPNQTGLGS